MVLRCLLLLLLTLAAVATAQDVRLASPLVTVVEAETPLPPSASVIEAEVLLPPDAPADLGIGLFVRGDDGRWFQHAMADNARRGERIRIRARLDDTAAWTCEPDRERWTPYRRALARTYGIFAWSAAESRARLRIARLSAEDADALPTPPARLLDLALDGLAGGVARCRTGERWQLSLRPSPFPAEPYHAAEFTLDLEVTAPSGARATIPGFHDQPMRLSDRGDREDATPTGAARFCVRFRPREPGVHRLALRARWNDGRSLAMPLPDLVAEGEPWDDIVRVDAQDRRFLSAGAGERRFAWPIGLNLQSPNDPGASKAYKTTLTPDRGTVVYDATFARLAAAGGDSAEIWLSSWNLGLEWSAKWRGYHGIGRINEMNAARLDRVLDLAWRDRIRLVLNLNNHGQYLPNSGESEWQWNPFNRVNGGPLGNPEEVFTHPAALAAQADVRRYLAARYADHPATLVWKLWSEVDLTTLGIRAIRQGGGGLDTLAKWHREAADAWHRIDAYGHPVATHVATTYQNAHPAIMGLREIDLVGIDCYFQQGVYTRAEHFFGLMVETMDDRSRGLAKLRKPVITTEYGGGWQETSWGALWHQHRSGAWLALVTGQAMAPMLWWHEWVDQRDAWQPYGAIRAYVAGEDLRGDGASSVPLTLAGGGAQVLGRGWRRKGLLLGYVQDVAWGASRAEPVPRSGVEVVVGAEVEAGRLQLEWWDADTGKVIERRTVEHAGGRLALPVPTFTCHIALKLRRE